MGTHTTIHSILIRGGRGRGRRRGGLTHNYNKKKGTTLLLRVIAYKTPQNNQDAAEAAVAAAAEAAEVERARFATWLTWRRAATHTDGGNMHRTQS